MSFTASDARELTYAAQNEGPLEEVLRLIEDRARQGESDLHFNGHASGLHWRRVYALNQALSELGFDVDNPIDEVDASGELFDIYRLVIKW